MEYETLKSKEIEFGDDEFIQLALKKAVSGEGEKEFVSISRGFVNKEGEKRFKSNFSLPSDVDVVDFVSKHLPEMMKSS
jgi:hypothetical protein